MRAGRTDIHARAADLIVARTKTARSGRSLNVKVDTNRHHHKYSGRRVELIEAVCRGGVTTSDYQQSSMKWFTELNGGR